VPGGPFPAHTVTRILRISEATGLKAIYQIPLCVSFVLLVVQSLRVTAATLLDYVIRHTEDDPQQRW
jgi:hypothetical protein